MSIWLWAVMAGLVIAAIALWYGLANKQKQQVELERERYGSALATQAPEAPEEEWREGSEGWVGEVTESGPAPTVQDAPAHPELNITFEGVVGAEKFGPTVLAAGSHLTFEGVRYLVAGTGALKVGGLDTEGKPDPDNAEPRIWYEHMLQGGDTPHWISVEDIAGRIRLGWWENRAELKIDETATEVEVEGITYRRVAEGGALFAVSGLSGTVTQGQYFYTNFEAAGALLRLETWGVEASPGASIGRYISPDEVVVESPQPPA
ncbi:DUF4178 domain-containing protein [Corynebacterium sp. A21]|uniref:DUF4178 domain-containing protein n=1 Tax=Corynebacterium sp. A21 TaxID=3457318 RepID=UPI003FD1B7AA